MTVAPRHGRFLIAFALGVAAGLVALIGVAERGALKRMGMAR